MFDNCEITAGSFGKNSLWTSYLYIRNGKLDMKLVEEQENKKQERNLKD